MRKLPLLIGAGILSLHLQTSSAEVTFISQPAAPIESATIAQRAEGLKHVESIDNLDGIVDKASYILKHRVSFEEVVARANKSEVILFCELHPAYGHGEMELKLLRAIDNKKLAYAYEDLGLDNKDVVAAYLKGDESARKKISSWITGDRLREQLDFVGKHELPILLTDIGREKRRSLSPGGADPYARMVRDQEACRAIIHARTQGYRIFGVFGDLHVQDSAMPSYLRTQNVLVISGASFSRDVFTAAMNASEGKWIFFNRGGRVLYVDPSIDWNGAYRR